MNARAELVSVAMATYNGEKFVAEQLNSILRQTYPHIEIVVVDDGSSDGTVPILRKYAAEFPSICIYQNDRNLGVSKTFEKAVGYCRGTFIALSDQDDVWMNNKIAVLVQEIGHHDAVYSNSMLVDKNGTSYNKPFNTLMHLKSYYNGVPFLLSNTVPGHTILAKSSFLKQLAPFNAHLYFDLWIAYNAAAGNGLKYVDQVF